MISTRQFIVVWGMTLLSACSLDPVFGPSPANSPRQAYPAQQRGPKPVTVAPRPESRMPEVAQPQPSSPAVIALMQQAANDRRKGNLDLAVSRLERAVRIQPRNPRLWHELAEVRLQQHQPRLAEELAKKSIALAQGNKGLIQKNWRLIAKAREMNGDISGARRAAAKAGAS